jgi:hypothetical protein
MPDMLITLLDGTLLTRRRTFLSATVPHCSVHATCSLNAGPYNYLETQVSVSVEMRTSRNANRERTDATTAATLLPRLPHQL